MSKKNPLPKGYWEASISLDHLFDYLLLWKAIKRDTYDTAQGFLLNEPYLRKYVKKIRVKKNG